MKTNRIIVHSCVTLKEFKSDNLFSDYIKQLVLLIDAINKHVEDVIHAREG